MSTIAEQFKLNHDILKETREQMGLSLEEVKKKVPTIELIETQNKKPTYKQLDDLSELYQVPRWVFVSDELPQEYRYAQKPAFRAFKKSVIFDDFNVRQLITRTEQYRDLFFEMRQDLNDPIDKFKKPDIDNLININTVTDSIRDWLSIEQTALDFSELRNCLEQKSIFIFLTSKYKGWSFIDRHFRGLAIPHEYMPIIIINDSDSKKAQSFTLMHELGHLIRGDMGIDGENTEDSEVEKWCDRFAGEFLMPANSSLWNNYHNWQLSNIKKLAKEFKVSPYACLVRLKQLNKIDQKTYDVRENELKNEYKRQQEKLKQSSGGPPRDRSKEVRNQFGNPFVRTVLTTWQSQGMTLHKATKLLDLKRPNQVFDLENSL